jgi:surface antigen
MSGYRRSASPIMRLCAFALDFGFVLENAAPAWADPPPWAPAHGYRAKGKGKKKDREEVYVVPYGIAQGTCYRELVGAVVGGVAGGAAGSQIGKGDGRTVAIIGGTILGVIVGGSIGREMDRIDQNCVGQILEHAPDRQRIVWADHDNNSRYSVEPGRTFQQANGRYCREYTTTAQIGGRSEQVYGTACRQPDGSWQLVN